MRICGAGNVPCEVFARAPLRIGQHEAAVHDYPERVPQMGDEDCAINQSPVRHVAVRISRHAHSVFLIKLAYWFNV
jgi:hypothetical protein